MPSTLEIKATEIVLNELPNQCAFVGHMEGCNLLDSSELFTICQELQLKDCSDKQDFVPSFLENPLILKVLSGYIDPLDFKYALLKNQWDGLLVQKIYEAEKLIAKQILEKITFKVHLLSLTAGKPSEQLLQFLFADSTYTPDIKTALGALKQNQIYFDEGIILCSKFNHAVFPTYWEQLLNKFESFPKKGFKRLVGLVCSIGAFEKIVLSELDWLILEGILDGQSTPDIQNLVHRKNGLKSYSVQTTPLIRTLEILQLCEETKIGRRKIYDFPKEFKDFMSLIRFKNS